MVCEQKNCWKNVAYIEENSHKTHAVYVCKCKSNHDCFTNHRIEPF